MFDIILYIMTKNEIHEYVQLYILYLYCEFYEILKYIVSVATEFFRQYDKSDTILLIV